MNLVNLNAELWPKFGNTGIKYKGINTRNTKATAKCYILVGKSWLW